MQVVNLIAEVLKKEGIKYLSAFPTTPVIEGAARVGIRPIICRQERVGVGIADGYSRVTNGAPPGVFAMQYGPGAENAFAGVATAYSDGVPMLLLPLGHPMDRDGIFPHFNSVKNYGSVIKHAEYVTSVQRVVPALRRAFSRIKMGRPGPVLVEIPADLAVTEVDCGLPETYSTTPKTSSQGDPRDIEAAATALIHAENPIILAGQGVLYAEATSELVELAELLQIPVMTTMAGKSGFPEHHSLALGSGSGVMSRPVHRFLSQADVILAIGTSLTKHGMTTTIPDRKVIIQATNDPIDIGKDYWIDHPIVGDAKAVLRQFIDATSDMVVMGDRKSQEHVGAQIASIRDEWLTAWMQKLTSKEKPITPYRVIREFIQNVDADEAIVTHDSGSPRDQIMPFYRAGGPRTYLGWGKSHGLGTGLGLTLGAKLADPAKFCVNFMGDAAFGMTGLDFEVGVRSNLPILTVVFNNSTMAIETDSMAISHGMFNTRDLGGNYADLARAMGGWAERIENPEDIAAAIIRAKEATENGESALLEFITSEEREFSHKGEV